MRAPKVRPGAARAPGGWCTKGPSLVRALKVRPGAARSAPKVRPGSGAEGPPWCPRAWRRLPRMQIHAESS
eukprot:5849794-Alexandrium_andersonii.AAC.1